MLFFFLIDRITIEQFLHTMKREKSTLDMSTTIIITQNRKTKMAAAATTVAVTTTATTATATN